MKMPLGSWPITYKNPLHQTPRHHPIRPSIHFLHRFSVTNSIYACNLLVFVSTTLQNFHMDDQSFKSRSQQNEHVFIYNAIRKRMLSYDHSLYLGATAAWEPSHCTRCVWKTRLYKAMGGSVIVMYWAYITQAFQFRGIQVINQSSVQ